MEGLRCGLPELEIGAFPHDLRRGSYAGKGQDLAEGDQTVRIRVRKRPEQDAVQNRKQRRGGSHPQGQNGDHAGGKRGIAPPGAQREPRIPQEIREPAETPRVAKFFLGEIDGSELAACAQAGFFRRQAARDVVLGGLLQVGFDLTGHAGFEFMAFGHALHLFVPRQMAFQDEVNRGTQAFPAFGFLRKRLAARFGEPVVLGFFARVVCFPAGGEQAALFHAVQSGIERALPDLQCLTGHLFDAADDAVTVQRFESHDAEDQQVQRALKQGRIAGGGRIAVPRHTVYKICQRA
ncbi:hypothetical protein SBA4_5190007 [Candidatus Sulfopaludibacter sp. SbA4]|nr:hypothetical protein SBA4_5190007 [Candidatus Sulfopaludibacter sp. SbA4]